MRTSQVSAAALVLLFALTAQARIAQAQEEETKRIQESIEVLDELTATPENGIPEHLLERAEAIVVIPSLVKGGFIIGAKHGEGVMSVRDENGAWSPPAFMTMTGGSIGWQIGAQSIDLVLLVMNKNGIDDLLDDKFTLGGSASVAAGPVGRSADAATNPGLESQILAYSRAKGLFAGATLEGASLRAHKDAIEDFYGRDIPIRDIVAGKVTGELPTGATTWRSTLARLTSRN